MILLTLILKVFALSFKKAGKSSTTNAVALILEGKSNPKDDYGNLLPLLSLVYNVREGKRMKAEPSTSICKKLVYSDCNCLQFNTEYLENIKKNV